MMSNFFQKLGLGLKKSSTKISNGLTDIFTKRKINDDVLEELEELLISADMGVNASAKIMAAFSRQKFGNEADNQVIKSALANSIEEVLRPLQTTFEIDVTQKPYVVLMVGVNGAGKTTTIGKLAAKLKKEGRQVSFIAADTFRAAAVEQLKVWGEKSNIRVYSGENGCDSAGLCYDGLNLALKSGDDVVFIDTAGRLQNKNGLMDELQKMVRVIKKVLPQAPHRTLLTIDATTGQNAVSQVRIFKEIAAADGLVVTKLDGSAKGGILAAIAGECPLPVYFVGVGEKIEDLDVFKADEYARSLIGL